MSIQKRVLFIDNFDSFVHNLADEFRLQACTVEVIRNHIPLTRILSHIEKTQPHALVFSPGPGSPDDAKLCLELLDNIDKALPVLGICLGHQAIVQHFGGKVTHAAKVIHGKQTFIKHSQQGLFTNLEPLIQVGRYHSLVGTDIPEELIIDAQCEDEVMAVRHRQRPIYGLQFHPESILTPLGYALIANFLQQEAPHGT